MDNNDLDIAKRTKPVLSKTIIIIFTILMTLVGLFGLITVISDFNLLVKL